MKIPAWLPASFVALLGLTTLSSPAFAAANTVAVTPKKIIVQAVQLGDTSAQPTLRSLVEAVGAAAEHRPTLQSPSVEEAFSEDAKRRSGALSKCGSDAACIGRTLETWNLDLGLLVLIDAGQDPATLDLLLLPAGSAEAIERRSLDVDANPQSILTQFKRELASVLDRADFQERARLDIRTIPASALIQIDGAEDAMLIDGRYYVPEGQITVSAIGPGYITEQRTLSAVIGTPASAEFTLKPESQAPSKWLWIGLGAGAAAIIAGAVTAAVLTKPGPTVCLMDADPNDPC